MRRYRGKHPTSIAAYREADTQTGAAERRPHNGWEAREAASVTGHRPRIPLASRDEEPPVTNALSSPDAVRRKHLTRRPLTTAYSDGPVAGPKTGERGTDENGNRTTLRCLYTKQKSKKRKVWSDGAVSCCPKRQRVALHRWSEVLGVTDKLLGEIYLSVPEYDAFVTQGEPELEMEVYMVTLDGVIQDAPHSTTVANAADRADASAKSNGRKRKLLKPFKPPTRRAPPAAPADDYARFSSEKTNDFRSVDPLSSGNLAEAHRFGAFPERTSYTGFGHVESLWDDEEEGGDKGSAPAGQDAAWRSSAGRGDTAYEGQYDGRGVFVEAPPNEPSVRRQPRSSVPSAAAANMSDYSWREEDHGLPSSASAISYEFERGDQAFCRPRDTLPSPCGLNNDLSPDYGGGQTRRDTIDEGLRARMRSEGEANVNEGHNHGAAEARDDNTPHSTGVDDSWISGQGTENTRGFNLLRHGIVERDPALDPPKNDDGGVEERQTRSTQDILSLFGGGLAASSLADTPLIEPERRQQQRMALSPLGVPLRDIEIQPANEDDAHVLEPHPARYGGVMPPGGKGRAAEIRRALKERSGAENSSKPEISEGVVTGTETEKADDVDTSREWACDVCGVRGAASSISCRVCGAERRQGGGVDHDERGTAASIVSRVDSVKHFCSADVGEPITEALPANTRVRRPDDISGFRWKYDDARDSDGGTGVGVNIHCSTSPGKRSFSQVGGLSGSESKRPAGNVRMQMDFGSSSGSDDD